MAKKKKTLDQQYDEQVRRIEKRLQQLADEGYDIVNEQTGEIVFESEILR